MLNGFNYNNCGYNGRNGGGNYDCLSSCNKKAQTVYSCCGASLGVVILEAGIVWEELSFLIVAANIILTIALLGASHRFWNKQ